MKKEIKNHKVLFKFKNVDRGKSRELSKLALDAIFIAILICMTIFLMSFKLPSHENQKSNSYKSEIVCKMILLFDDKCIAPVKKVNSVTNRNFNASLWYEMEFKMLIKKQLHPIIN